MLEIVPVDDEDKIGKAGGALAEMIETVFRHHLRRQPRPKTNARRTNNLKEACRNPILDVVLCRRCNMEVTKQLCWRLRRLQQ